LFLVITLQAIPTKFSFLLWNRSLLFVSDYYSQHGPQQSTEQLQNIGAESVCIVNTGLVQW